MVTFKRGASKGKKLQFFGKEINEANSMKVLGITLGKNSTMMQHCREKAAVVIQRTNWLRMVRGRRWGANSKTLLRLYLQLMRPVLEYAAVAFTQKEAAAIKQLELAERKALRVVLGVGIRTPNKTLYEKTGIQPISERIASLRSRAISRFNHNSKGLRDLAILKNIIGVQ
jgi:hypothetical protein